MRFECKRGLGKARKECIVEWLLTWNGVVTAGADVMQAARTIGRTTMAERRGGFTLTGVVVSMALAAW